MDDVVYRVNDPMELLSMPQYVPLPVEITPTHPIEIYCGKDELLSLLERNVEVCHLNGVRLDKSDEDRAERTEVLRQLTAFRDWVRSNPNKWIFVGCYPSPEFTKVSEPDLGPNEEDRPRRGP